MIEDHLEGLGDVTISNDKDYLLYSFFTPIFTKPLQWKHRRKRCSMEQWLKQYRTWSYQVCECDERFKNLNDICLSCQYEHRAKLLEDRLPSMDGCKSKCEHKWECYKGKITACTKCCNEQINHKNHFNDYDSWFAGRSLKLKPQRPQCSTTTKKGFIER